MSDKAREWTVYIKNGQIIANPRMDAESIRVIEYSAYKSIVAQLASERDAFGKLETELIKERDLAHNTANELRLKNLDLIKHLARAALKR